MAEPSKASTPARDNNKMREEDRPAHDWYRFVLAFPPHIVREYLARFGISHNMCVLDPFCGTGTTLVECKKLGITSVGVEANRMASFASEVKVNWNLEPDDMLKHANMIADRTSEKLAREGITDTDDLPLFEALPKLPRNLRTLPSEASKLLLKNSISPLPLHRTLALLETLDEHNDARFIAHERLALAKQLVSGIGNVRFGPEVGVARPKRDAPVISMWLEGVKKMTEDLRILRAKHDLQATVHNADSRQLLGLLDRASVDVVITSPPYPNEKDYSRTTRLESVLLGFLLTKKDLRSLKQGMLRSNTRGVYKGDSDDMLVADNDQIQRLAEEIENRRIELGKTSGFERLYARVTKLYFGGMTRHLSDLRAVLRPGAQLAYVVGDQASYLRVLIPTGQILADIARSRGYDVLGIDLFRTRLATATKKQLREEVVLLRWPGTSN